MEQVLDYHNGAQPRRYTWRGVIVLLLAALALMISVGLVASILFGRPLRIRFARIHGIGMLVMAFGPPVTALVVSIVLASTMGRRAEARRGRRLAIGAIVLSVVNILAIVATPVALALSFGMGRTLNAEERRSEVEWNLRRFSAQLGPQDSVVEGTLDGGRDGSRWYLLKVQDVAGLKRQLLGVPRGIGVVNGGQSFIREKPPSWWKIKSSGRRKGDKYIFLIVF